MSERLDGIVPFVHAVEAGSFAQAAERLHLSRSAVGKAVARLEARLGVRLFHRTTRTQSLTEEGQAFYERCERALAELSAGEAAMESRQSSPRGKLRVSVPVLFGRLSVAPVLREWASAYPDLRVEVSFADRVVDLVEEGYDLGVRIGPLGDSASLRARKLGTQRMSICASPAYLRAHGHPRTPADLDGHMAIVYRRRGADVPWKLLGEDGRDVAPRIAARLSLDDVQAIVDAAVAGAGLARLPCWLVAQHVQRGELEVVFDAENVAASDIHVVWPTSHHLPSKTRGAIDALVAAIPASIEARTAACCEAMAVPTGEIAATLHAEHRPARSKRLLPRRASR